MKSAPFPIITAIFSDEGSRSLLASNGFSLVDVGEKRAVFSDRCASVGLTYTDLVGASEPANIHPADLPIFKDTVAKLLKGEIGFAQQQYRFIRLDGPPLWLSISFRIMDKAENGFARVIVLHDEDITQLQATQEEIRERLMEIDSLKELLFSINASLDFDETLKRIIQHLHRIIPFDRATVQRLEGDTLSVLGCFGYTESTVKELRFTLRGMDSPSARAVASRRPIICNDVERDFPGFIQVDGSPPVKSWLGIPLVYEGRTIGLFALDSFNPRFYEDRHARIASNVAEHIAIAVEHARQHSIVKEEARTDKLTGVANRYGLDTIGQEIFLKASRSDQPLGLLMLDIDFFKKVNDAKGHAYGDMVLRVIARGIQGSLRAKDYLVRFGGEEFLILLPETTTREALVVAERLRNRIPRLDVDGSSTCPTVSIGVFSGIPGPQDLLHDFIHRADLALYDAKQAGRDRCRVWGPRAEYYSVKP
ncbi:MAG TPA: sensor domain-containing diguanylate cyclase [Rectinemataceae bacterium]